MRQYPNLSKLLATETLSRNPRTAAKIIEDRINTDHPRAEAMVLFTNFREKTWTVVPVGPSESLLNTGQASRASIDGKNPVAYCTIVR